MIAKLPNLAMLRAVDPFAVESTGEPGVVLGAPVGFRCDHTGCVETFACETDQREGEMSDRYRARLRSYVDDAVAVGWQCLFIDGKAHHWCPNHVDVDRERLRRWK